MTLSRVIGITTKKFYTNIFGFEVLGDNIKMFYKKSDIMEVRQYVHPVSILNLRTRSAKILYLHVQ